MVAKLGKRNIFSCIKGAKSILLNIVSVKKQVFHLFRSYLFTCKYMCFILNIFFQMVCSFVLILHIFSSSHPLAVSLAPPRKLLIKSWHPASFFSLLITPQSFSMQLCRSPQDRCRTRLRNLWAVNSPHTLSIALIWSVFLCRNFGEASFAGNDKREEMDLNVFTIISNPSMV